MLLVYICIFRAVCAHDYSLWLKIFSHLLVINFMTVLYEFSVFSLYCSHGTLQNCVDTMEFSCGGLCHPANTDWKTVYRLKGEQDFTV